MRPRRAVRSSRPCTSPPSTRPWSSTREMVISRISRPGLGWQRRRRRRSVWRGEGNAAARVGGQRGSNARLAHSRAGGRRRRKAPVGTGRCLTRTRWRWRRRQRRWRQRRRRQRRRRQRRGSGPRRRTPATATRPSPRPRRAPPQPRASAGATRRSRATAAGPSRRRRRVFGVFAPIFPAARSPGCGDWPARPRLPARRSPPASAASEQPRARGAPMVPARRPPRCGGGRGRPWGPAAQPPKLSSTSPSSSAGAGRLSPPSGAAGLAAHEFSACGTAVVIAGRGSPAAGTLAGGDAPPAAPALDEWWASVVHERTRRINIYLRIPVSPSHFRTFRGPSPRLCL